MAATSIPSISVGLRKGIVFVTSSYTSPNGMYVDCAPVYSSPSNDPAAIGRHIQDALLHFADSGPWPLDKSFRSPVLDAAGVKTWNQYERGLESGAVRQFEDHLLVMGPEPHIRLPRDATPEQIGVAMLKVLGALPGG
jgi:hypothetical protein